MRQSVRLSWLLVVLTVFAPLVSACSPAGPIAVQASVETPLPQAVEAYMAELPGPSPKLFLTTRVYDRQGTLLGEFWDEGHRYWTPLQAIAPALRQATVATEDKTFYTNPGVDWSAIARAVLQNTDNGEVISGASTITQQLARNIAMPYEKRLEQTLDRKLSETVLAQDLTQRFSKDQILEMYLNVVYYGHLAYGVEAAARVYFAKSAANLSLAESALLAALPQSPANLDPLEPENRERAKSRQGIVLALMARNGYITPPEAQAAYAQPLQFQSEKLSSPAPHFLQYVHDYLAARYGKDMVGRGGLSVVATIDLGLQARAEQIVRQQVAVVRERYNLSNAALVAIKPATGEILAMVGSANFADPAINGQVNVVLSPRQPGSSIKPILYALAFSRGLTPADLLWDTPVAFKLQNGQTYRPVNYDGRFHGPVRLRQALANSYNVPAVKLLNRLGVPAMLQTARAFGISTFTGPAENYGLSLTLGGSEVTLLDLTGAFATLANRGQHAPPTPILQLTDSTGHVVQTAMQTARPVVDERVAYMLSSILSDNEARTPAFGANSPLHLSRLAAVKTGTTTDWRDNWTIGYTPYLAVGVWAGNSNGQPMRNSTGLTGAAPIWHDFMEAIFADPALERKVRAPAEPQDFRRPAGLVDVPICNLLAFKSPNPVCPAGGADLFIDPAQPITIGLALPTPAPAITLALTPTTTAPAVPTRTGRTPVITATKTLTRPVDPALVVVVGAQGNAGQVCSLPQGGRQLAALRLPTDAAERQYALSWASQVGIPVDAGPCTAAMLTAAAVSSIPAAAVTANAQIYAPTPGSTVGGAIEVVGTAQFSTDEIQFYKVEFGYGGNPPDWITMGSGHPNPVTNDRLETWHAESLPNGTYALRIVLVKRDGNYLATAPVAVNVQH